jgi:hypothetical protein
LTLPKLTEALKAVIVFVVSKKPQSEHSLEFIECDLPLCDVSYVGLISLKVSYRGDLPAAFSGFFSRRGGGVLRRRRGGFPPRTKHRHSPPYRTNTYMSGFFILEFSGIFILVLSANFIPVIHYWPTCRPCPLQLL